MHEIFNQQRDIKIDLEDLREFLNRAGRIVPEAEGRYATVALVTDEEIQNLNRRFREKNRVTDVLSFPFEADEFDPEENRLGDIVISVRQAEKQASENDLSLELELKQLILHGVLHLCGFDHETDGGEMNEYELKLRDKLKINV